MEMTNTVSVVNGYWEGENYVGKVGLHVVFRLGAATIVGNVPLDDKQVNDLITSLHANAGDRRSQDEIKRRRGES